MGEAHNLPGRNDNMKKWEDCDACRKMIKEKHFPERLRTVGLRGQSLATFFRYPQVQQFAGSHRFQRCAEPAT